MTVRWVRGGNAASVLAMRRGLRPRVLALVRRLFEKPTTDRDHRVGGQNDGLGATRSDHLGLGGRQPLGQTRRRLPLQRGFVYIGRVDVIRLDSHLRQQFDAAWAGRGQRKLQTPFRHENDAAPYLKR